MHPLPPLFKNGDQSIKLPFSQQKMPPSHPKNTKENLMAVNYRWGYFWGVREHFLLLKEQFSSNYGNKWFRFRSFLWVVVSGRTKIAWVSVLCLPSSWICCHMFLSHLMKVNGVDRVVFTVNFPCSLFSMMLLDQSGLSDGEVFVLDRQ